MTGGAVAIAFSFPQDHHRVSCGLWRAHRQEPHTMNWSSLTVQFSNINIKQVVTMAGMSVTVLCPAGRRVNVKVTPNTSILQVTGYPGSLASLRSRLLPAFILHFSFSCWYYWFWQVKFLMVIIGCTVLVALCLVNALKIKYSGHVVTWCQSWVPTGCTGQVRWWRSVHQCALVFYIELLPLPLPKC